MSAGPRVLQCIEEFGSKGSLNRLLVVWPGCLFKAHACLCQKVCNIARLARPSPKAGCRLELQIWASLVIVLLVAKLHHYDERCHLPATGLLVQHTQAAAASRSRLRDTDAVWQVCCQPDCCSRGCSCVEVEAPSGWQQQVGLQLCWRLRGVLMQVASDSVSKHMARLSVHLAAASVGQLAPPWATAWPHKLRASGCWHSLVTEASRYGSRQGTQQCWQ